MARANEGLSNIATLPDVRGLFGTWDELSARVGEQSTALSRDVLSASLQLAQQSASSAAEWMQTWGQGTRQVGELAQAAERRVDKAEDVAGVWNLELGLLGETAQAVAASGQDAWLMLARTQAALMQSALAQGAQAFERLLHTANGTSAAAVDKAAELPDQPIVPFVPMAQWPTQWPTQWPALAESMTQGAQALWNAMAASSQAALQAPAEEAAPAAAPPAKRRARPRKR